MDLQRERLESFALTAPRGFRLLAKISFPGACPAARRCPDLPVAYLGADGCILRSSNALAASLVLILPLVRVGAHHGELPEGHCDSNDFIIPLVLEVRSHGDAFESMRGLRDHHRDDDLEGVRAALHCNHLYLRPLSEAPGTLAVSKGRYHFHRPSGCSCFMDTR